MDGGSHELCFSILCPDAQESGNAPVVTHVCLTGSLLVQGGLPVDNSNWRHLMHHACLPRTLLN